MAKKHKKVALYWIFLFVLGWGVEIVFFKIIFFTPQKKIPWLYIILVDILSVALLSFIPALWFWIHLKDIFQNKRIKTKKNPYKITIFIVPNMTLFFCENWDLKNLFFKKASSQIKKLINFFGYWNIPFNQFHNFII